jgi:hypothetical protein
MTVQVDSVIVVSRKLYEEKQPFNAHTYLVPSGVNYRAYEAAMADPHLPDDLREIRELRLGYIGLIGDKLDLKLLSEMAREHPQWSLILLGGAKVSQQAEHWRALQAMPNVHHLGPISVSQVPHNVKGF